MIDKQVIEKVRKYLPCLGHFAGDLANCNNSGYHKYVRNPMGILEYRKCPFERDCKKITREYISNSDPYNFNLIDKPRKWLKELER